jgi:DNA-binding transcriptional LysR family regulator
MNYNYLRYFSVLAQVEHYTLAAARLGISQPSLSSAIHNLETELGGIKLFEKVGRNIRLTEEGRYYRERVDAALHELDTASITLRDSKVTAPVVIRMGLISGTLSGTVAKLVAEHIRQDDRIRFLITESESEELMDLVRQEKLDMAIVDTTNRDRSLHFRKLCQRNFFVALPEGHPLAEAEALSPQELTQQSQVVFNSDFGSFGHWASGAAGEEHIVCTVNTSETALDLVAAGVGFCLLSETCVTDRAGVRFVPVKNWYQAQYMCILYDKWLEPPIWSFVEKLVKTIRSLEAGN